MRCPKCGGEVNLTVCRCIVCGSYVDETDELRIARSVSELTESYDFLDEEKYEDKEPAPALFSGYGIKRGSQNNEPQATYTLAQAKKPNIELDEYMELIGDNEQPKKEEPQEELPQSGVLGAVGKVYDKIEKTVSPQLEKVVDAYHEHVPQLKRAKTSSRKEKLTALIVIVASLILIMIIGVYVSTLIPPNIKGEWLIEETGSGDMLTVEFTGGGDVIARIYSNGEEHIYREGEYKTRKKNGYNMLIIDYDDGEESRLYYTVTDDGCSFTNVDSNESADYIKLK